MSGQYDGDGPSQSNAFAARFGEQPWLRGNVPPWHMWGTTETLTIPILDPISSVTGQQLSRVNYRRPETWHWLFFARFLSGPTLVTEGNRVSVGVAFDLTIGLGRASVTLPDFMVFLFQYTSPAGPGTQTEPKWSTVGYRPNRTPIDTEDFSIQQVVAEDIQCAARIAVGADEFPLAVPVVVEVGAFFAPKNHIRPDWLQLEVPVEAQFTGAELAGR